MNSGIKVFALVSRGGGDTGQLSVQLHFNHRECKGIKSYGT